MPGQRSARRRGTGGHSGLRLSTLEGCEAVGRSEPGSRSGTAVSLQIHATDSASGQTLTYSTSG
ncbi:hypothetical protein UK12_17780 [Saccharothrix sp. ST-888]|nr:hypothetical protein UK12_17780 [Saccharothrix sp. ST-888]